MERRLGVQHDWLIGWRDYILVESFAKSRQALIIIRIRVLEERGFWKRHDIDG